MKRRLLFYSLLLVASASCQREKPVQSEASRPVETAPALADSLPETPASGSVGSRRDWHQLARRTSRNAPLIVYRRGQLRAPGADTTSLPPSEARLHDLTLKASEYFQIDPTQPAEVHGREGTVVRIPAGVLVTSSNQPATNPVWVELKECYSVADMLLSNLSTVTPEGELLESGGIVLVRASAKGQQLRLAPGQGFQLEMPGPASRRRELKLFYGQGGRGQQPVRWVAAGPAAEQPLAARPSTADQMPTYGSGPADINKLVRYPQSAVENKTEGIVYASFLVDEAGRVESPTIVRGIGGGCDEEVLRVLRQTSGHWTPARSGGQLVKVKMVLPIRFSFQEGLANSDATATASAADSVVPTPVVQHSGEEADEESADNRRVYTCSRLGWLNADRPLAAGSPVDFAVPVDVEPGTSIRLVFEDCLAIAEAQPQADGYAFQGIPANRKVVLVGVQYRNGTPFLAMRRTVTGQASTEQLVFQETTLADLERAMEKIQ
ncbi:energy transducer TonB [Hymenobacter metallicola]|nr:energy transducer TonB [Hymenobacter metallicola]